MKYKPSQPNTSRCPFAASPQAVFSITPPHHPSTSRETQGWRNLGRIRQQGPAIFAARMADYKQEPIFKVKIGPKTIQMITNGQIAEILLTKHAEHLGRGHSFGPFKLMVGDVFFIQDGPSALKTRKVFLQTIARAAENFQRIEEITEHTFTEIENAEYNIPDLYAMVARYTIRCIAACFVGTNDLCAIPADTYKIFLQATRQITQASMDPISRVLHPNLRRAFYKTSTAMAYIAKRLLHANIDAICQGNNYIWDLAIFRAQQCHPEMNFNQCKHYVKNDPLAKIIRNIIKNDRFILEHGPLTIFASSNVGAVLFYLLDILSRKPEIVKKMQEEMTLLDNKPLTFKALHKLRYARAVAQEALWQATPIPTFPREVLSAFETTINGKSITFEEGNILILLFRFMQGAPRPFSPEAWLNDDPTLLPKLFAFGTGHRQCPARPFAVQMLMQFLVGMISRNLHIVLTKEAAYTTENGNLGPDYHENDPITAEMKPLAFAADQKETACAVLNKGILA